MSLDTRETSSPDIYLPPGLILPGPDESAERFRREVFNHPDHSYEELVDYGAFATALIILAMHDKDRAHDLRDNNRRSAMPTQSDFLALAAAGYGLTRHCLYKGYGGEGRLQVALGFFPSFYHPSASDISDRLKWMSTVFPYDKLPNGEPLTINGILDWGTHRNLLPSREMVRTVLGRDTGSIVQRIFGTHRPNVKRDYSVRATFMFGQKILDEHDASVQQRELEDYNDGDFTVTPYAALSAHHKTLTGFWAEFGRYGRTRSLSNTELIEMGVRATYKKGGVTPSSNDVKEMSKNYQFTSIKPILKRFNSYSEYRQQVEQAFAVFRQTLDLLRLAEVSEDVIDIIGGAYSEDPEFQPQLLNNEALWKSLSNTTSTAVYARKLLKSGFDLRNDEAYRFQVVDLQYALRRMGINNSAKRYILGFMPRQDVDETLRDMKRFSL